MITLHIQSKTRQIAPKPGETLYDALIGAGVEIAAPCAGRCFCGKCLIKVEGAGPCTAAERDLLSSADVAAGMRLACAVPADEADIEVFVADKSRAEIMTEGVSRAIDLKPSVRRVPVKLVPPTLDDPLDDLTRLSRGVGQDLLADLGALAALPKVMKDTGFAPDAFVFTGSGGERLIAARPAGAPMYGVAVDIGTTTISSYLLSLETGEKIDVLSRLNPQRAFGADVISRGEHAGSAEGLAQLRAAICGAISDIAAEFVKRNDVLPEDIAHVTCVGNTVMMHLLLGLPPTAIMTTPFNPVTASLLDFSARELGVDLPFARVSVLPCVAGYVGADTVAAVLACGMHESDELSLMIDIGTNGEMALGSKSGMLCCSTAAGPAFEGAHIRHGLGGVTGAISAVMLAEGVSIKTIGGEPAIGICGSGLVDAVAEMKRARVIDEMGRIDADSAAEALRARVIQVDGKPAFLLASTTEGAEQDICITQRDLREVQLAKAAIAAGIISLVREAGVELGDVKQVYLAGGFGNYIGLDAACEIGLLPPELRDRIESVGNAAGAGAQQALLSSCSLAATAGIKASMRYIELATRPDFQDLFVDNMMF